MIQYLARVNTRDKSGCTALHIATTCNEVCVLKILLEARAGVNVSDDNGRTPLMEADQYGYTDVASLLIKNGSHK